MGKLEGKVALITGGSSGLALASAKRFVEEGAYVFITGRRQAALDEEGKRQMESLIPRGKMGRPEEIASTALFLASDDSSFVNGVELSVDGGLSAI